MSGCRFEATLASMETLDVQRYICDLGISLLIRLLQASWHTIPVFVPLTNLLEEYNKNEKHVSVVNSSMTLCLCLHNKT